VSLDWDARSYDRLSGPQQAWGADVLERLELRGDETVLDAGCGTGRVTAMLLERLPRGRVIAVDASPAMTELARAALPADRVEVITCDLLELHLHDAVDAVLSTATFHWILDHRRLFERMHAALRPGGRLVAQCGGAGNIAAVRAATDAADPRFEGWSPWRFATPEEAEADLHAAGFAQASCWLQPWPVTPSNPHEFVATVVLGAHLDRLPEAERPAFVAAVLERMPRPDIVDYVRLNIEARRRAR
jgi:trans-aconitate 2-methyltransferase